MTRALTTKAPNHLAHPKTAAKHPYERQCPRCLQWRVTHQIDATTGLCLACPAPRTRLTRTELITEVAWLLGTDTPDAIARRLGYRHLNALQARLHRAGRGDLARALQLAAVR